MLAHHAAPARIEHRRNEHYRIGYHRAVGAYPLGAEENAQHKGDDIAYHSAHHHPEEEFQHSLPSRIEVFEAFEDFEITFSHRAVSDRCRSVQALRTWQPRQDGLP